MKGKALNGRTSLATIMLAVTVAAPLAVLADQPITYYTPPALVKRGANSSPVAAAGTVVVQVLVNKDGSFKVQRVIHSTNPGNNAAALEIAKSSSYKPASRGSQKLTSFYDFTLRFTGKGGNASTADEPTSGGGGVARYEQMIRAGNYAGAQSGLRSYVAEHPTDASAQQSLAVADTFLNQYEDAAAAFDKGGTPAPKYKSIAAKAYAEYAATALKNNDSTSGVAAAQKAATLEPSLYTYNALGSAQVSSGQNDAAIASFEKARSLGKAAKASDRALIDANLAAVYLNSGKPDMAKQVAAEATQLDPSAPAVQNVFANYYAKQAQAAAGAGKNADAAALYEQGAAAAPSQAAILYTQAAFAHLNGQPKADDLTSAKADADKALALKPDDASANYAAGISLADQPGKSKDALVYLNKADTLAKTANDSKLTAQIEAAIKQLNGSSK